VREQDVSANLKGFFVVIGGSPFDNGHSMDFVPKTAWRKKAIGNVKRSTTSLDVTNDPEALVVSRWLQFKASRWRPIKSFSISFLRTLALFYPKKLPFPGRVLVNHTVESRYVSPS
jgi:hypothetical protein